MLGEQSLPSVVGKPSKCVAWKSVCGTAKTVSASWLASAGFDGEVRIWNTISGTARHTLTGHTPEVRALAAAPAGSWLASASDDRELRIWNPATGAALTSLRVAGQLSHLLLASTTIAAAGEGGLYLLTLCHRLPIPTDTLIDQA